MPLLVLLQLTIADLPPVAVGGGRGGYPPPPDDGVAPASPASTAAFAFAALRSLATPLPPSLRAQTNPSSPRSAALASVIWLLRPSLRRRCQYLCRSTHLASPWSA